MNPDDPYAGAVNNFLATQASAPAEPSAIVTPAQGASDPYAGVVNNFENLPPGVPGDVTGASGESVSTWVGQNMIPLTGAGLGAGLGGLLALKRAADAFLGHPSVTRSARAAFKQAAKYQPMQDAAPVAPRVDPTLVDPNAILGGSQTAQPAAPEPDPSLVKYTRTQIGNPETLTRADLDALQARTASQVQQRLAAIADRAARNARLSQGFQVDPVTGLQVPQTFSAPPALPDPFAGLNPDAIPPTTSAATDAAARARAAYEATKAAAPTALQPPAYWKQMQAAGRSPEAAGEAAGALESVYPSTTKRAIAAMGSRLSPILGPVLGAAGAGANTADLVQQVHKGNYWQAVADAAGALGGALMIPDNPVTPPIGAALSAVPVAYGAWTHVAQPWIERKIAALSGH
jgi:hypothetical protein